MRLSVDFCAPLHYTMDDIPGPRATLDDKIDFLIKSAVFANTQFTELRSTLSSHTTRITAVETEVGVAQQETKKLKTQVNKHEQQSRSLQIRVLNVPFSPDETVAKLVYDKAIRPILTVAKDKGKLAAVPQLSNTIVEAYRMRSRSGTTPPDFPPHIMVRLTSPALKSAIFTFKKLGLPSTPEGGLRRINIVEELTPPTFQFLKTLKADSRFASAWTVEGQIKYILASDSSKTVKRVLSVFEHPDTLIS